MLGRFGLLITLGIQRNKGHMHKGQIPLGLFPVHLPDSLQERHTLYISNCTSNLHKTDIGTTLCSHLPYAVLDLVCDMRDYLYGLAKIFTPALLCYHSLIYLTGGQIMLPCQFGVKETFIITKVQINLTTIL